MEFYYLYVLFSGSDFVMTRNRVTAVIAMKLVLKILTMRLGRVVFF